MRTRTWARGLSLTLCTGAALLQTAACSDGDCDPAVEFCGDPGSGAASSSSGTGATGASGGTGGGGGTPDGCVPSEEENAVEDGCGVFVSSSLGADGNPGTKEKPFKTIADALAAANKKPIYVCAEAIPYPEAVEITVAANIYGGLDCTAGWAFDAAKPTRVAPAAPNIPLRVVDVSESVRIEDFEFVAADATAPGGSSIAAFVSGSSDVTLRRTHLVAGTGEDGENGLLVPYRFEDQLLLNGNDAMAPNGGGTKTCSCPAGDESEGGPGGSNAAGGQPGGNGSPDHGGGQGGAAGPACGNGSPGNPAPANGDDAVAGATTGSVSASSWEPTPGAPGMPGIPGQGGGGGASDDDGTGAGGGGGCGGCGGAAGPGGTGGGASIALLVLDSTVMVENGTLSAADAGKGGNGAAGQPGQSIAGEAGNPTTGGCLGGPGGAGSAGGAGGGGAGGVSAGVVHKGSAPMLTGETSITKGAAGGKGIGGIPGTNDGVAGASEDVLEVN